MNILFFSRLFYPNIGGVEKHVLEISKRLIAKGHSVTIVTEELSKALRFQVFESINIYRIPIGHNNWFRKFRIWKEIWKIRNLMRTSNIVHCHDVFFWYLPFRFLFPFKKVFTTFHGYENYPLKSKDVLAHKIAEKLSVGNICIGHFIKKWYGTKSDYVSYGGVNIAKSEKLPASQRGEKVKSSEGAVFIGRLDETSGILTYAKVVKLIRKKIPDFKFEIIGDGKLRREIEKNFKVLGFQKNPEKYLLKYNFAFVSGYLSILEALAAKRLVFAVYDNILKEDYLRLSSFSKFITVSNSASELVSKIIFYLDNIKKQEKLTEDAYKWVKNHTWEEVVNTYLKLWKL